MGRGWGCLKVFWHESQDLGAAQAVSNPGSSTWRRNMRALIQEPLASSEHVSGRWEERSYHGNFLAPFSCATHPFALHNAGTSKGAT